MGIKIQIISIILWNKITNFEQYKFLDNKIILQ